MNLDNVSRHHPIPGAIVPFSAVRGTSAYSAVTVSLIGYGSRGTFDAGFMAEVEGARLVAHANLFADLIEKTRAAAKADGAKAYSSGAELLEKSGVDGVGIGTPVYLHPEHLEAAVRAGKNVYLEKPAGADTAGVKRLMAAASADRKLNIASEFTRSDGPFHRNRIYGPLRNADYNQSNYRTHVSLPRQEQVSTRK